MNAKGLGLRSVGRALLVLALLLGVMSGTSPTSATPDAGISITPSSGPPGSVALDAEFSRSEKRDLQNLSLRDPVGKDFMLKGLRVDLLQLRPLS